MVPDGACLQFGIGGIPNAVAKSLTNHKDLGIHTEMLTTSVVDLYEAGAITNNKKNIHRFKTVYTLCWGQRDSMISLMTTLQLRAIHPHILMILQ